MTLVARVPDIVGSREPGCMACAVDAMEWGWGENAGCISKIITFVIVFFATVIAIFSLIGIPFIFCTLYEYGSRNTAERVDKVMRTKITELTQGNHEKQVKIDEHKTRIDELRAVRDRRGAEIKALKKTNSALTSQVDALEQQLKEAQEAALTKGTTLKADVKPLLQKNKQLEEEIAALRRENAGLQEHLQEMNSNTGSQKEIAIGVALQQLMNCKGITVQDQRKIDAANTALRQAVQVEEDSEDELDPEADGTNQAGSDPGQTLHVPDHKENKEPAKLQPTRAPAKVPSSLKL